MVLRTIYAIYFDYIAPLIFLKLQLKNSRHEKIAKNIVFVKKEHKKAS